MSVSFIVPIPAFDGIPLVLSHLSATAPIDLEVQIRPHPISPPLKTLSSLLSVSRSALPNSLSPARPLEIMPPFSGENTIAVCQGGFH